MAAAEGLLAILTQRHLERTKQDLLQPCWSRVALVGENLCFSHQPGPPTLNGVNLRVPAGGFVLLSGPSGSGKTSLLRLFLGTLRPAKGRVLVNGTDLAAVELTPWLRHLAWMPQNPYLLPGTILANIFLGSHDPLASVNLEEFKGVARLTGLDRDVVTLPHGWQTVLGEGWVGFSGGQRQRLALTRALVKQAPLLLLDEPTAHLDELSCQTVLTTLRALKGKRTLVVASHDPRLNCLADMVLELGLDAQRR